MIRWIVLCLLLIWVRVSLAAPLVPQPTALNDPLAEQIETLQATTQAHIDALLMQMEGLEPAQKQELERQIVDLKQQGEIDRLTLLLESAQAADDANRVADIQKALDFWKNPPQTQILPQISTDKTPPSNESRPASEKPSVAPTTTK